MRRYAAQSSHLAIFIYFLHRINIFLYIIGSFFIQLKIRGVSSDENMYDHFERMLRVNHYMMRLLSVR